jgi:hypothetical protein
MGSISSRHHRQGEIKGPSVLRHTRRALLVVPLDVIDRITMSFAPRILALPSSSIGLIFIYQYRRVTMSVAILGRLLALEEKFSPNPQSCAIVSNEWHAIGKKAPFSYTAGSSQNSAGANISESVARLGMLWIAVIAASAAE